MRRQTGSLHGVTYRTTRRACGLANAAWPTHPTRNDPPNGKKLQGFGVGVGDAVLAVRSRDERVTMQTTDANSEMRENENASHAVHQLEVLACLDPTALLTRPDVVQTLRHATASVVESDVDRFDGLRGVMVGRAYSIAYQELGQYDAREGSLLGWLSQKVQAGLRRDFA